MDENIIIFLGLFDLL